MSKTQAFRDLGFEIGNPMNQWSAENESGVCITLWRKELAYRDGVACMDTKTDVRPITEWSPVGARLRQRHLEAVQDKFDSRLSVVILEGEPGKKVTQSTPWFPPANCPDAGWVLTYLERDTGHFGVKIMKNASL